MSTKADKLSTIGPVLADIFGHWWNIPIFSTRCNIYISPLCYDVSVRLSVRLSVTEVHWCIIANLCFNSDPNLPRIAVAVHAARALNYL